jgi:putative colanic acid biosynthesis acetyltransferase WcaF
VTVQSSTAGEGLPTRENTANPGTSRGVRELEPEVQDISSFSLPYNFRGRSAVVVVAWWFIQSTLFAGSPQGLFGFRRWLLRLFGAAVGKGALIRPTARITYPWKVRIGDYAWIGDNVELYSLGQISIGNNAVVSQRSYLCAATHDYRRRAFDIVAIPIVIEDEAWVAADVFIAPGVTVGRGAVVGARSSVFADVPPMMVSYGSPAFSRHPRI